MDEPGSKLGRDSLGAHATFARLAAEESKQPLIVMLACRCHDSHGTMLGEDGSVTEKWEVRRCNEHLDKSPMYQVLPQIDLESAVISAAIRFRKAESAVWQTSEVGTKEESANAKHERAMAYLDVVDSVDALIAAREEQKIPGAGSCKDSGTRRD